MPPKDKKKSPKEDNYDSDESVDSKGNIRDLIDYDYTSDDSDDSEYVPPRTKRTPRKAAVAAQKKINKVIKNDRSKLTPTKRKYPFKSKESKESIK